MEYEQLGVFDLQYQRGLERLEGMLDAAERRNCVRVLEMGAGRNFRSEDAGGELGDPVVGDWNFRLRLNEPDPRSEVWGQPLARLLSTLYLKKLIWISAEPVPFCVLSVLRERMPKCRLYIQELNLLRLHQRKPLKDIDEIEYPMALSPSIYRIIAPYSLYDRRGRANYNEEAVLRLVAGLAPNLRHVGIWDDSVHTAFRGTSPSERSEGPEWSVLHLQTNSSGCEPPIVKGQLLSLEIACSRNVSETQLASWEAHTDFSVLTSLKLSDCVDPGVLLLLADVAERRGLDALKILYLPLVACGDEDREVADLTITRLLLSLPPLEELDLDRVVDISFEVVLAQHNTSLRILRMAGFVLSLQQVAQLRERCLHIRELSISILRSAGDATEVETYRTLGFMRYLESVELGLHCTEYRPDGDPDDPWLPTGPCDNERDREVIALVIRRVFINAAIDEDLARSIFHMIWVAHKSVKAELPPRLSRMRLKVICPTARNDEGVDKDFGGLIFWIGQGWNCERKAWDTHQGEVHRIQVPLTQLVPQGTLHYAQFMEKDMDKFPPSASQYIAIWQSLWPRTGAGWKRDWRSFPLACGADE